MENIVYGLFNLREERELAQASYGYIQQDIADIKSRYIALGFHLDEALTMKYYEDFGYTDFYEFCEKNFHMEKSAVSRSINMWKAFAAYDENSYSRKLWVDEKYAAYNYSQLCEMLPLNEKERKKITPDMTVKEIREKKKAWKQKDASEKKGTSSVATSQQKSVNKKDVKLIKPDENQKKYFEMFARKFIDSNQDWLLKNFDKRVMDVNTSPLEIKKAFGKCRRWCFSVADGVGYAYINLFDEYVQIWDENGCCLGNFEWFYVASAIQSVWNVYALELLGETEQEKEVVTLQPESTESETEIREVENAQPELPVLKNNNQRKEWLNDYRKWGLWYKDEHIDVNYYKYDFSDGSRLIVAEYPQRERYWTKDKSDEYFFHFLEKKKQKYDAKNIYDKQFMHAPESETYLVDFLKKLQKKK